MVRYKVEPFIYDEKKNVLIKYYHHCKESRVNLILIFFICCFFNGNCYSLSSIEFKRKRTFYVLSHSINKLYRLSTDSIFTHRFPRVVAVLKQKIKGNNLINY